MHMYIRRACKCSSLNVTISALNTCVESIFKATLD